MSKKYATYQGNMVQVLSRNRTTAKIAYRGEHLTVSVKDLKFPPVEVADKPVKADAPVESPAAPAEVLAEEVPQTAVFTTPYLDDSYVVPAPAPVVEVEVQPEVIEDAPEPLTEAEQRPFRHRSVPLRVQEGDKPARLVKAATNPIQQIPRSRRHNLLEPKFKG